jgi:hypothetical protein
MFIYCSFSVAKGKGMFDGDGEAGAAPCRHFGLGEINGLRAVRTTFDDK